MHCPSVYTATAEMKVIEWQVWPKTYNFTCLLLEEMYILMSVKKIIWFYLLI